MFPIWTRLTLCNHKVKFDSQKWVSTLGLFYPHIWGEYWFGYQEAESRVINVNSSMVVK